MPDIDQRHGIGGNNPPEPMGDLALMLTPAVLRDQLDLDYAHLTERRDELIAGVDRLFEKIPVIETIEQQARVADFKSQLDLLYADTETARVTEVKPFLDAQRVCQKKFKAEILDLVDRARNDVNGKLTIFQKKEDKRVADEYAAEKKRLQDEADKLAAEAAASQRPSLFEVAAEAQKQAEIGPRKVSSTVRGAASSVSMRTRFTYEEIDLAQVPREWLKVVLDTDRVQRAIDDGLRDGADAPAIPGLKIVDCSKAVVRR